MDKSNFLGSFRPLLAVFLLALTCSGCLNGNVFEFIAYDQASDTFRYLQLDLNVAGETSGDLEHLANLWNEREQVIMHPEFFRLWSLPAILRVDASHFKEIDLAAESAKENPTLATSIPLDEIKVQPGKFFLTKDNTLGYYHQVIASGKVVDEVMAARNKRFFGQAFVDMIDKEIKRRADGGTTESWDDVRRQINKQLEEDKKKDAGSAAGQAAPVAENSESEKKQEGVPLDGASMGLLRKAAAAGEIGIHRHGSELELALPLSPDDCREAKATLDLWKRGVVEHLKAKPGDYGPSLSAMFRAETDSGRRLVITVDVLLLAKLQELTLPEAKPDPKLTASYRDAIASLRSRGIPIDEKLAVKQVVDEFTAKRP